MKRKCEKVFILKKLYKELSSACKSMQHNNMNNAFTGSENITRNTLISILGGGALLLGGSAYGASADWTGAADDNWSEASNWSLSLVPNSAGTSVNFIHNDAVKIDGKTVSLWNVHQHDWLAFHCVNRHFRYVEFWHFRRHTEFR